MGQSERIIWFENTGSSDVSRVGGKNASLGEMISRLEEKGIRVPGGFATTAFVYREFLENNDIGKCIEEYLEGMQNGDISLSEAGHKIRRLFRNGSFTGEAERAIKEAYGELSRRHGADETDVAVRSSATAEDLPEASFAGQQETFLNIRGGDEVLDACRKCFASLFTDRAISYREEKGFDHMEIALSAGIQKMVRSDKGSAGVVFTIDTETGFPDILVIDAAWGLGENVVQGTVNPDRYTVFKPLLDNKELRPVIGKDIGKKEKKAVYAKGGSETVKNVDTPEKERRSFVLNDREILDLSRWSADIEEYYGKPMDIEWAKDGETGDLYIVQARPETVQSAKDFDGITVYDLRETGDVLLKGLAIGEKVSAGKVCIIEDAGEIDEFTEGSVLVTGMTDPDWVPVMKKSAGIVTDYGGRTCHAAIVSRELGIPAVVGTGGATGELEPGREVTLSCTEGEAGYIYDGILDYEEREMSVKDVPDTETEIMINIASPAGAFRWWNLPVDGIGLARMEFIINNIIKIHPLALLNPESVESEKTGKTIDRLTRAYEDKTEYFVDKLARGIARIAASRYPAPVLVRMSDFKTNEYADLIGGEYFEPGESNPMIGWRGASRYYSEGYGEGFGLECLAVKKAREIIGLDNIIVMIPFCRTVEEADRVLERLKENGLERGEKGLEVYVMCEVPSNIILADQFAERFDGFSIGSNDLTQLVLGVDRDSSRLSDLFDERNEAVKRMISRLIQTARSNKIKIGICGQAPSDYPEFAAFLTEEGIDSISLNPDSVIEVKKLISKIERGNMK